MNAKKQTIIFVYDNLGFITPDMLISDYILKNDTNNGVFDTWDDEEQGMTADEYKAWVNRTYAFTPSNPNADIWVENIKYNEL